MKKNILLIEDDPGLVLTLTDRFEAENYLIDSLYDGSEVLSKLSSINYDLIILDIMLRGKNGFEICEEIRSRGINIPILMLTAKGQINDKVTGLKLGADDYLTKPFDILELLARVEALIRRSISKSAVLDNYKIYDIEVDFQGMEVRKAGAKIEMSQKEFQLLKYLIINRGRSISRDEILNEVWGYEENPTTRTIDTHIGWLRQKLETNPKYPAMIETVYGFGYKFVEK